MAGKALSSRGTVEPAQPRSPGFPERAKATAAGFAHRHGLKRTPRRCDPFRRSSVSGSMQRREFGLGMLSLVLAQRAIVARPLDVRRPLYLFTRQQARVFMLGF